MSHDPRIEVPEGLRDAGIFGGIIMMILGLLIGWARAGMSVVMDPTGNPPPAVGPSAPGILDRLAEAIISRINGLGKGG